MQAAHIIEDVQGFERRPKRNDLPIWARYANGEMALVGKLRHQHLAANFPSNVFSAPAEGFDPRAAVKEHEVSIHARTVLEVRVNLSLAISTQQASRKR